MASVTKYAGTVTQTTGGHYVSFDYLSNIMNAAENSHAVSSILIQGKSETKNRPSTISCTGFNFNLPLGAEPVKIVVEYRHRKNTGSDYSSKYPKRVVNIPAPTISLLGVSGFSGKGVAPTTSMKTNTKTFNVKGKITRAQLNSTGFGCRINYPTNTNKWNGYLRVSYVRVRVEYVLSDYTVKVDAVDGYNNEAFDVTLRISNKNLTRYNPTLTLTTPVGFTYESYEGTGRVTKVNNTTYRWEPSVGGVGTSNVTLRFLPGVTYPSGSGVFTGAFTLSESLNGANATKTVSIREKPVTSEESETGGTTDVSSDTDDDGNMIIDMPSDTVYQVINEEFKFIVRKEDMHYREGGLDYWVQRVKVDPATTTISADTETTANIEYRPFSDGVGELRVYNWGEEESVNFLIRFTAYGVQTLSLTSNGGAVDYHFYVRPQDSGVVNSILLQPTSEEQDRLGNGYPYIAQADMKQTTTDTIKRNWYKNNRIGVFNNPISANITITETTDPETGEVTETVTDTTDYENLTPNQIIENAEYWSQDLAGINQYDNVDCEFTYNENYPLYIIITGDHTEAESAGFDPGNITFDNVCIIEKQVYKGREQTGNYPEPISNLLDENIAETSIPNLDTTETIVLYDFPLEEEYGTDETHSIRGIEVTGTIEQADEMVLSAKLVSPSGETGERTIIINNQDTTDSQTEFRFGGLGDLWGFQTTDLTSLEDWEVQIFANNILLEEEANLNFGDIRIGFYIEELQEQLINVKVNGEDLSYYGAFIEDAQIPEGLDTDTSFLSIDGTDTNDAYRQNIREKTIELEMSIGECDLQTSTDMLRQLTKLLVNEKDEYNRPIPNTIEFSHYPDVYFEYIMTDTMDISTSAGAYNIKAKLTIPAGTAYSKQNTSTNITGFVQGIASVNPVISLKAQEDVITLQETVTGQKFTIGYDGDWQTGIVEIDCEERRVYHRTNEDDTEPTDLSKYVDFNSDWFNLHGEYNFNASGCTVRKVEFTERW